MPKILLVAEKPAAARDFAAALTGGHFTGQGPHRGKIADGAELTVVSARGHLFELAKPETYDPKFGAWNVHDLPIVPTKLWDFIEEPRADAEHLLSVLRQEAAAHAGCEIVNGCDAEREGEVIFRKALRGVHAPAGTLYSRMWAQTMTVSGLQEAFAARLPLKDYNGLAQAGFTRDQADWLVGMNVTVLATKTLPRGRGDWKVWSVGRVQTPTLALVVARDLLIENFVPQKFWEAHGTFGEVEAKAELDAYAASPDRVKLLGAPAVSSERDKKVFWGKTKAEAFAASAKAPPAYRATEKKTTRTEKPPLPFDLQEMQKLMSKKFGLTATDTLAILQKLYDAKLISYPRTDCRFLREDMKEKLYTSLADVHAHLRATRPTLHLSQQELMSKKVAFAARAFDDSHVEGHYGLVPTGETNGLITLAGNDLFAFLTVVQTTLMALDEAAKYRVVLRRYTQKPGSATAPGRTESYAPAIFRASREQTEFPGFNRWVKRDARAVAELPPLNESQTLTAVTLKELTTKPPEHFTDATLLDAMKYAGETFDDDTPEEQREAMVEIMKDKGIGTAATRANIIEKILLRGFVTREKSKILSAENGRLLCRELATRAPSLLSAKLTGEWELILKKMERNTTPMTRPEFLDALLASVVSMKTSFITGSARAGLNDPVIPVTAGTPVEGAICPKSNEALLDRGPFFEAPGFPDLRLWKSAFGRVWDAPEFVALLEHHLAGKPYHAANLKSANGGRAYEADLVLDAALKKIVIYTPDPTKVKGIKCPKSGKLLIDHGNYFEASGWPGVKLWKNAFGKVFTAEDYVPILQGWKDATPIDVTGLVSAKSGKPYTAKIILEEATGKMKLDFGGVAPPATPAAENGTGVPPVGS
jgi:DNA topoisomerase-3